jgi:hypothetical protein
VRNSLQQILVICSVFGVANTGSISVAASGPARDSTAASEMPASKCFAASLQEIITRMKTNYFGIRKLNSCVESNFVIPVDALVIL